MGGALAAHDLRAQAPTVAQRADERTITGQVIGTDGKGLPGVTVIIKGGARGTTTDIDGRFSLAVPAATTRLVFSFVGYVSQEIPLNDRTKLTVTLESSTGLDEVVVVGYGITQARRENTGTIAVVEGKAIANTPVQSFDQQLQGRAAGVNVTTPNGLLNNPPVIRIRGINSINLSSQPLIVIDGVPTSTGNNSQLNAVPNNPLANINPQDIENVEVLKDAASTAIYGSRATNGVILVTTKHGRQGQSHVGYNAWLGLTTPVRLYNVLGAQDYMNIKNEAVNNLFANRGLAAPTTPYFRPSYDSNNNLIDTRWYDYIYQTGVSSNQSLNFSGGNEKTTYYASVDYTNQKGMLKKNEFERYSGRFNVDHKVFSRLTVGAVFSYSHLYNRAPNSGSVSGGAFSTSGLGRIPLVLPPNIAPFNADGSYNTNGAGIGAGANLNPLSTTNPPAALLPGYYNPVVDLDNNYFISNSNQIQGNVYADLEPLKGLHLRSKFGISNNYYEDKAFYTPIAGDGYSPGGEADNYYHDFRLWDWQNTGTYSHSFGNHNFDLLVGNEQQTTNSQYWGASRTQVADLFFTNYQGNFTNISASGNGIGYNYLVSFFGRFAYNYDHKYLLSFNARRDGYSAFADKWGNFYGGSLGYIISEEGFYKNAGIANVLNFLKVQGSYGSVGNNQGVNDFASLQLYGSGLYGANANLYYNQAGNPALKWETSRKTDITISTGWLKDRLTVEGTYYRNLVDGLILPVPTAPSLGIPAGPGGYATSIPANVGSMLNRGFEVTARFQAIQHKAFSWTVSGNYTSLHNEVLTLVTGQPYIASATSGLETVNYTTVGRSIGSILVVQSLGVNPDNGRRMIQKADGSVAQYQYQGSGWTDVATGKTTTAPNQITDGVYYGPVLPTWYGGLDNNFTLGNFDLGIFLQYSGGNYIYNGTKAGLHDQRFWNNAADIKNHWTSDNRNALYPAVVYGDNVSNGSALPMSSNVEKGDFLRVRNIALGYTLRSSLLSRASLSSARLYVQVQNALLITKYSGIDPEISTNGASNTAAGVDRNSVGQARTFTAGLNVNF
ncbi:SusC/RagA family TonB-linked outer membrane protein [Hymenobacter polaris]|uniref:SusC/RagA family TonB-linked outer membrane protein n=1 Tax=Hymenobacter polaris TaxID=2682546 RepID=UPI00293C070D|nr:SusC/RagA family TonB-linked outer membrane protein [Hymenobacter polaris]